MAARRYEKWVRLAYLAVAAAALASSGCLAVAAGAAVGGGAAAGYYYLHGRVVQDYAANVDDVTAATRTALRELGMPVLKEEHSGGRAEVASRTADGTNVHIDMQLQDSAIPAEGAITHVGVRVSTFGDAPVSERILDQIGAHLAPVNRAAAAPPQTAAPPLLPAEPVPAAAPAARSAPRPPG
jgi:hypothetical protein